MSHSQSDSFSSRIGFVLAAAGSAVGLGNIWRFPYLAAKHGGGIFLITYLVVILTFGYALMLTEDALGRMTQKGPVGAFRECCEGKPSWTKFIRFGGYINAFVPLLIMPYYCVIGGWVTKYTVTMLTTPIQFFTNETSGTYFSQFISNPAQALFYFLIFAAMVVLIVALGVKKGIESSNKILMPALVLLCLGLCIYSCYLPNASVGIKYYLTPKWEDFSYMTVVAAIGQAFFSLSLAMGISFTYGSYMRKEDNLPVSVNQVAGFDTGVAFMGGMMVIPAVVVFGGTEAAKQAGPGLVFITLPQVFASFHGGGIVGFFFFLLILFAAVTSAISILETNVQTISQEFHLKRTPALLACIVEFIVLGVLPLLGYSVLKDVRPLSFIQYCQNMDLLDSMDFLANNIIMPLAAIFTACLALAVVGLKKLCQEIQGEYKWRGKTIYLLMMRILVIPCLVAVLLDSLGLLR